MTLINSVRRGSPLTEEDGAILLEAFCYKSRRTQVQRTSSIDDIIGEVGSLKDVAFFYLKDPRTIRRWCEMKFFPTAYQTKGGHWRIPLADVLAGNVKVPEKFARKPKSLFGTKEWRELKARLKRVFRGLNSAWLLEGGLRDMSREELFGKPFKVSEKAMSLATQVAKAGVEPDMKLRLAARRIRTAAPTKLITVTALAKEMGLSRASLYRLPYGAKRFERAIKEAGFPLKPGDPGSRGDESEDEAHIREMFEQAEGYTDSGGKLSDVTGVEKVIAKARSKGRPPDA